MAGDVPGMAALDAQLGDHPWSEQNLYRYCDEGCYHGLVVEQNNEIAGFILYSTVVDEGSIDNVAVNKPLQGQGMGTELVCAALSRMTDAGLVRCMLDVRVSNAAARALYEKHGFVEDGVRPRYYVTARGHEDAVLMSRRL